MDREFWKERRVMVTGHTGFKGGWLALWLQNWGAEVSGYSLPAPTDPSLFDVAYVADGMKSVVGDIRNLNSLVNHFTSNRPEILFHLAAQPLVRQSYKDPIETYSTNVMGTVNVLEAARSAGGVKVIVIITSDKCYENREWYWGYREDEPMGGYDPYSSSKGCAELVTSAYRRSYFHPDEYDSHGVGVATARSGNVVGGGDWSEDRLVPDIMKALLNGNKLVIRNPEAVRPWQHVLEPLGGYLLLARRLWDEGPEYSGAWNFGPMDADFQTVGWVTDTLISLWGSSIKWYREKMDQPHEATLLKLDCSKARIKLGWNPKMNCLESLVAIVDWYKSYKDESDMRKQVIEQIERYLD